MSAQNKKNRIGGVGQQAKEKRPKTVEAILEAAKSIKSGDKKNESDNNVLK